MLGGLLERQVELWQLRIPQSDTGPDIQLLAQRVPPRPYMTASLRSSSVWETLQGYKKLYEVTWLSADNLPVSGLWPSWHKTLPCQQHKKQGQYREKERSGKVSQRKDMINGLSTYADLDSACIEIGKDGAIDRYRSRHRYRHRER